MIHRDPNNDSHGAESDVKGAGIIDSGFVVNPANLQAYVELIAKDIAKHSRTRLTLTPILFGPGLQVRAAVFPLPQKPAEIDAGDVESATRRYQPDARSSFHEALAMLENQESAEGVIRILLADRGSPKGASWLVESGKTKPVDPEQQSSLDAAIQALAEAPDSERHWITIEILSQADAGKIMESPRD